MLIEDNLEVNAVTKDKDTALHYAAEKRMGMALQVLIQCFGASVNARFLNTN